MSTTFFTSGLYSFIKLYKKGLKFLANFYANKSWIYIKLEIQVEVPFETKSLSQTTSWDTNIFILSDTLSL
jgi:hypothetical protein